MKLENSTGIRIILRENQFLFEQPLGWFDPARSTLNRSLTFHLFKNLFRISMNITPFLVRIVIVKVLRFKKSTSLLVSVKNVMLFSCDAHTRNCAKTNITTGIMFYKYALLATNLPVFLQNCSIIFYIPACCILLYCNTVKSTTRRKMD